MKMPFSPHRKKRPSEVPATCVASGLGEQLGRDTIEATVWAMSAAEALLLDFALHSPGIAEKTMTKVRWNKVGCWWRWNKVLAMG
jgi:hypothetical protein